MASADDVVKYVSLGADLLGGLVKGVGLAMQAFGAGNFNEGLSILDDTLYEGRASVAAMNPALAKVKEEARRNREAKFPEDKPSTIAEAVSRVVPDGGSGER